MNRRLQDPFLSTVLPDKIDDTLEDGSVTCVDFNRLGNFLAAGCSDGTILIYDFDTRGVHQKFKLHSTSVACVSWARSGCLLASATALGEISVWDVAKGVPHLSAKLEGRINRVSLSRHAGLPGRKGFLLISFSNATPMLIDLDTKAREGVPTFVLEEGKPNRMGPNLNTASDAIAVYDKRGRYIFMAQSRGSIAILNANSLRFYEVFKLAGVTRITGLTVDRKGRFITAICQDRTVRVLEVLGTENDPTYGQSEIRAMVVNSAKAAKGGSLIRPDQPMLAQIQECSIPVDKLPWNCAILTHDTEYVLASPSSKEEHKIWVWPKASFQPARQLSGEVKEGVAFMAAHPYNNSIITVGASTGHIHVWQHLFHEDWSAFAPGFKKLEQNEEYDEAEDEFDINSNHDDEQGAGEMLPEEDSDVDIVTNEDIRLFSSDDEDDQIGLHRLPAEIVPDPLEAQELANGHVNGDKEQEDEEEDVEDEVDKEPPSSSGNSLDADEEMADASADEDEAMQEPDLSDEGNGAAFHNNHQHAHHPHGNHAHYQNANGQRLMNGGDHPPHQPPSPQWRLAARAKASHGRSVRP
eukprot:jgi/Botrbrau1/9002/Bobra.0148s0105.1